ncbi:hypothetical protein ACFQX7_32400 [Luedemannella flava]
MDTPEATLLELVERIADEDPEGACSLFTLGAQTTFAQESETKDCVTAMQIVVDKVTDKENFEAAKLKPSGEWPGVVITGDSAEFGSTTCTGWDGPGVKSGLDTGDLGRFGLKKTDDGWLINENKIQGGGTCGG